MKTNVLAGTSAIPVSLLIGILSISVSLGAPWAQKAGLEVPGRQADQLLARHAFHFEENRGQAGSESRFVGRAGSCTFLVSETETRVVLTKPEKSFDRYLAMLLPGLRKPVPPVSFRIEFAGANQGAEAQGEDPLPGVSNYFLGNDPAKWQSGIRHFRKVRLHRVYEGIDMLFYGNQDFLEFDFLVRPEADPSVIALRFPDVERLHLDSSGDLAIGVGRDEIRLQKPKMYQDDRDGRRREIPGDYLLEDGNLVRFMPGPYDSRRALVIDPVLSYSTYLAGSGRDVAQGIAVDSQGFIYVTGRTQTSQFLVSEPMPDSSARLDLFVAKLNPQGSELMFITFLGGQGDENYYCGDIALDSSGSIYVAGETWSSDFPTVHAHQASFGGGVVDAYICKLSGDGSQLLYSSYLGGSRSDSAFALAVHAPDQVSLAGGTNSTNFPLKNAFQNQNKRGGYYESDAFLTRLDTRASSLVFSTFLGGAGADCAFGVAVMPSGETTIVGGTESLDFPIQKAFQPAFVPGGDFELDSFVARFSSQGESLEYSSFLGGSGDEVALDVDLDATGAAWIVGVTTSSNFPTAKAFQPQIRGGIKFKTDAFVTKIRSDGSGLEYSTFLGGSPTEKGNGDDVALAVAVGPGGEAYVAGATSGADFPTVKAPQPFFGSAARTKTDVFVTRFSSSGNVECSTYFGGESEDWAYDVAVGPDGSAYVTGDTKSVSLPVVHPLASAFQGGLHDAFVARLAETKELFFAQFGDGAQANTSVSSLILLYNLNASRSAHASVEILGDEGDRLTVDLNGVEYSGFVEVDVPANGLVTLQTDGQGPLRTGSVRIACDGEVSGTILFQGFGTAGVQANSRTRKFVVPVFTGVGLNSGVAMMGLGQAQSVQLELRDESGVVVGRAVKPLTAKGHWAGFITDLVWDPATDLTGFTGTLSGSGASDFAAVAILSGAGVFATLPVKVSEEPDVFYFAQFGDGTAGGATLSSDIALFNLSRTHPANSRVYLEADDGKPLSVDVDGSEVPGEKEVPVPPSGIKVLRTDGKGELRTGSIRVLSDRAVSGAQLSGVILFRGFGLAGVLANEAVRRFRAPVRSGPGLDSGIALRGVGGDQVVVLELRDAAGLLVSTANVQLKCAAHIAKMLGELEWNPPPDLSRFSGTITGSAPQDLAAAVILVTQDDFATLPVTRLP